MAILVPGSLFFHYVATNLEIRRHYAILIGFVSLLLVAKLLPRASVFRQEAWKKCGALFVTMMVAGHAFYLYSYLLRPSWMDTKLVLRPYFEANRVIREKFPDANILAASDALGTGLEYPPVMEAASSFSLSPHIRIHTKLSGRKWATLQRAGSAKEMLPFALNVGYEMVQWGPLEERMWGEKVKRRFIDEKQRLLSISDVGLYRLSDSYGEELRLAEQSGNRKMMEALGYRLQKDGWLYEAYEAFKLAGSREGAADVLEQSGFTNDAKRLRAGANQLPKLP
jgi:hypothetical protein